MRDREETTVVLDVPTYVEITPDPPRAPSLFSGALRWPVVALAAHAVVSELIQGAWLPNRAGDPFDLLADGVGIGLGVWAARLVPGPEGRGELT